METCSGDQRHIGKGWRTCVDIRLMRIASVIALALATVGCATLTTSDEVVARTCGISAGWHQLKDVPANSAELLSMSDSGKNNDAEKDFSSVSWTHQRWFGKGDSDLAYCRYQVLHSSCDWPNHTVQFQQVNGRWSAEQQISTVCVSANP